LLANAVLLVSELLLGYEEALWPKKLEISYFVTYYSDKGTNKILFLIVKKKS
jgi:hypothetical protein